MRLNYLLIGFVALSAKVSAQERPNIIWFLTEDLSPHFLALFNDGRGCQTPNLASLAGDGMLYPNAYSNAPVSSAARTTLITGCYAPSFAGSFHRHIEINPMPKGLHMFPYYLSQGGYYTINANKTDYNVVTDSEAWHIINGNIDTWRSRPNPEQPFFMQRSCLITHESKLLFKREVYDSVKTKYNPKDVYLLPHSADTDLMRYSYATIYDRIEEADEELGELIEMLKEDGEYEDTIILFFGDNGGTLPGTKGYSDNVGVQVPLVVFVPEKWRDKIGAEAGSVREDLVSFIDFAATTLNMAGIEIPKEMDGTPFLGDGSSRGVASVVCYADRFDEMYTLNRSIRKGDMRYERNFQPYQTQSLFAQYRYRQLAFKEWKQLYLKDELNSAQSRFFQKQGVEELYDLSNDPYELNNLANNPKYSSQLENLRSDMNSYMVEKGDLGLFPECVIHEEFIINPDSCGKANRDLIESYIEVADLQRLPFSNVREEIAKALNSSNDVTIWWALTTLSSFGKEAQEFKYMAKRMLKHERSFVRSRAMIFLSMIGVDISEKRIKETLKRCRRDAETLLVLNDITVMVENKDLNPIHIALDDTIGDNFGIRWRIEYLNSIYHNR